MKIIAKKKHVLVRLTRQDASALRELLSKAAWDKHSNPLTFLARPKHVQKVFYELMGLVDGMTFGGDYTSGYDDEDTRLSESYRAAKKAARAMPGVLPL